MVLKTKMRSFYSLIRHLFLVIMFCLNDIKNRNNKFPWLNKNFFFFYFVYGFKNQNWKFLWLDTTLSLVLVYGFNSNKGSFCNLTRCLFLLLFIAIKFITEFWLQKWHWQNCWKIPWKRAKILKICLTKDRNVWWNHF